MAMRISSDGVRAYYAEPTRLPCGLSEEQLLAGYGGTTTMKRCSRGLHDISAPDSVYTSTDNRTGRTRWMCKECQRVRQQREYWRRKAIADQRIGKKEPPKKRRDGGMSVSETDAFLERAERRSMLPAWMKVTP